MKTVSVERGTKRIHDFVLVVVFYVNNKILDIKVTRKLGNIEERLKRFLLAYARKWRDADVKGVSEDICKWRPITLLKTSYYIFASFGLQEVLPKIIHV